MNPLENAVPFRGPHRRDATPISVVPPASGVRRTVIYDNGRTIIRHVRNRKRTRNVLVITFAEMLVNDPEKPGFAQDFLLKNGYDVIAVQKNSESWYQDLNPDHFRRAIMRVSQSYDGLVCYGISMGAFAALYFGGYVNASIIAISPLCSIHPLYPALGAHEHRRNVLATQVDFQDIPKTTGRVCVIYDPLSPSDRLYIRNEVMPAFPGAQYFLAPGSGHPSSACLNAMGLLRPTVLDFLEGEDISGFRSNAREKRAGCALYFSHMADHCLRRKRPDLALSMVTKALELSPDSEPLQEKIHKILAKTGSTSRRLSAGLRAKEQR